MTRYLLMALIAGSFSAGCGASQAKTQPVVEKAPEPPPAECLPGCSLDDNDACVMIGNVLDPSGRVEQQEVECDPRCCEEGSAAMSAVDADADGIINDRDECVDLAEDFDGYQDEDGCPEEDNDGDKILDADDVCPLDAEDVDGFQDDDGCPD